LSRIAISVKSAARAERIGLVGAQLGGFTRQPREQRVGLRPHLVRELLVLLMELMPHFPNPAVDEVIELTRPPLERLRRLAQFARQVFRGCGALFLLDFQPVAQRIDFLPHELFEPGEPLLHLFAQLCRFLGQPFFEPRELAVVIAHVDAEQQIADLVEAGPVGFSGAGRHPCALWIDDGAHGVCPRARTACRLRVCSTCWCGDCLSLRALLDAGAEASSRHGLIPR